MTDQRKSISSVIRKGNQWVERTVRVLFILIFVFSGIGSVPLVTARAQALPLITVSGTMAAFNSAAGLTSAEQSYTVSAVDLSTDLVITAPQGFEISTTSGGEFTSTLTLSPDETGSLVATTIYVRFSPTSAADFLDVITHTSEGAEEVDLAVSGSSVPLISVTGSLEPFSAAVGSDSEAQSYQVSAVNLSGDLLISAPEHFTLGLDPAGDFSDTLDLKPEKGVVSGTSVYVIFESDEAGSFDGVLSHTSQGAEEVGLDVSARANPASAMVGARAILADVEINSTVTIYKQVTTLTSGKNYIIAALNSGNYFAIDQVTVPSSAYAVGKVGVTVIDGASYGLSGTNVIVDPGDTSIIWAMTTTSGSNYYTNGGYNLYGGSVNPTSGNTGSGGTVGLYAITAASRALSYNGSTHVLTSAGSSTYYITYSGTSFGASTTSGSAAAIYLFEQTTVTTNTPTVTVSASSLTGFNAPVGGTSAEQNYTISGSNLTGDITITPPSDTNIEISLTSGSGFVSYPSTLTIPYGSGTVSDTPIYVHLKPTSATTYTSLAITNTSSGATTQNVAVSGSSVPAITTTSTMSTFSAATGAYSSEQSYTVSAVNLTSVLTITPPAGFEISKTSGGTFVDSTGSLTYTPVNGVVSSQTIYVRFKNASAGTLTGNIAHTSGTASSSVAVSGTASAPTLASTGSLSFFNSVPGVASSVQSIKVSGTYLSGNVTVTAPTGYQVSTSSTSGFGSSVTLTPTSGTLASTSVYVELNNSSAGSYSGNVAITSSGASEVNVAATGYVYAWRAFNDCNINTSSQTNPTNTTKIACYSASSSNALKNYDSGATTGVTFAVALGSGTITYNTGTGVTPNSGTDAYNTFSGYANMIDVIKMDTTSSSVTLTFSGLDPTKTYSFTTSSDRNSSSYTYTTDYVISDIANTSITNASTSGVTLGTSSIAQDKATFKSGYNTVTGYVARWTGIQTGADGDFVVTYSTTTSQGYGPQVFMLAEENDTTPKITLSASSLTGFASTPGTASAAQTVTVTGANLTSPISVIAPTGFIVSSDGSTYDSTATLPTSGGTLSVKMLSSSEGTPSGSITLSSTGAADKTIAVSGTVLYQYTLTVGTDGNGTVAFSPSGGTYYHGQTVTLTPTGNSGYKFHDWTGDNYSDVVDTSGVYTIVMNADKSLTANFSAIPIYTLTTSVTPSDAGTITLNPTGGSYEENTVVTVTAAANSGFSFSSWSGDLSGTTASTTITMTGNKVIEAVYAASSGCATITPYANKDTYMSTNHTGGNYGGSTLIKVANNSSGSNRGALLQWDLSSIPTNAVVDSASITVYVTTSSTSTYNLYRLRRDWVEGSDSSGSTSPSTGASWTYYTAGTTGAWGTVGAANTTSDRYDTNLWGAGSSSFSSTGSKTVDLNSDGLAVLNAWVAAPSTNYGFTIQNYSTTSGSDDFEFDSTENGTTSSEPYMTIHYCIPATAYTLSVSNDGHGSVTINPSQSTYTYGTTVTLTPIPNSGYQFATWGGTNAEDPTDNGNGTWTITINGNKTLLANFTALPVNVPPNLPVLVSPSDAATGVSLSPSLQVTVSDSNSTDTLDTSFYGRKAGTTTSTDFTLVVIPDTQNESAAVMNSQFNWIASNKSSSNIVFATSVGDIVNTASSTSEWTKADTAYKYLDNAGVPYSVGPGNHDMGGLYGTYFGHSRFASISTYQGYYTSGTDNYNNYSFLSASGNNFIIINIQYAPTSAILDWADALLKANPTKRGIVVEHDILNIDNSWTNEASYDALRDNPNLFLMLCGHMHSSSDGSAYYAGTGTDGHTIHILQTDYQDWNSSSSTGYLRILRFSPAEDKIYATTYSPYNDKYLSSTSNYETATLSYDLTDGTAGTYSLIGTVNDVTNGSNASVTWSGLSASTQYEWYTTVSDGTDMVTGSTWSFTTGTSTNSAPVLTAIGNKSGNELSAITFTASATDDGLPSGILTYSLTNGTSGTVPTGASINSSTGAFTWTPTEAQGPGSYTFDVCVSDGSLSDCETITVTVAEVNTAPTITDTDPQSLTVVEDTPTPLTLHATDADGNTLTWSILTNGTHGTASLSTTPTGTSQVITYTPTLNSNTADSFVVQVSDGGLMDTITVNVTITPVNDAPVFTESSPQALTVAEDTSGTLTLHVTDVDTSSSSLTWSISTAASNGTASVSVTPTGTSQVITYAPTANYNRSDSFVVRVSDGTSPVYLTVNVTVSAVNDAPVITETSPHAVTVSEDSSTTLTLHATDVDTSASSLTWSISTAASHGTASVSATPTGNSQVITYSPNTNYDSADTFIVKVTDGSGNAYLTVNVTVTPVNDDPVISEGASTTVAMSVNSSPTAFSLTLNATDVDTLASSLSWSIKTAASHGTATASGTGSSLAVSYVPTTDYVGSDSFDVQVSDGAGGTDSITVNVTITANTSSQTISLVPGWNLISFKLVPSSTAIASVLSSIAGNYDLVYAWDAGSTSSDKWLIYDPSASFGNTLTTLTNTQGFWVHMTAADELVVTGTVPTSTSITLSSGWNLISFPSNSEGTLPGILSSLGTNYSLVYGYNSSLSSPWLLYDRTGASYANKLSKLTPGWGYWIKVGSNTSLVVTY